MRKLDFYFCGVICGISFLVFLVNVGIVHEFKAFAFSHFRVLGDIERAKVFDNMKHLRLFCAYGWREMLKKFTAYLHWHILLDKEIFLIFF